MFSHLFSSLVIDNSTAVYTMGCSVLGCKHKASQDTPSHTVTHSHSHTDTQSHKHTDTQSHRHPVTQSHRHPVTQSHRHPVTQSHRHPVTQTHRHPVTQTPSHTVTQSPSHTVTQSHRHTVTQSHRHTQSGELDLLPLRISQGASLGDFLIAPACPIDRVTTIKAPLSNVWNWRGCLERQSLCPNWKSELSPEAL